jgi:predicted nucleic acid-binding protein
MTRPLMKQNS